LVIGSSFTKRASETVEGCEIKKEPEEVMEQDTSLQNSDHEMETTEDENTSLVIGSSFTKMVFQ
jgi:hypothetical protein